MVVDDGLDEGAEKISEVVSRQMTGGRVLSSRSRVIRAGREVGDPPSMSSCELREDLGAKGGSSEDLGVMSRLADLDLDKSLA